MRHNALWRHVPSEVSQCLQSAEAACAAVSSWRLPARYQARSIATVRGAASSMVRPFGAVFERRFKTSDGSKARVWSNITRAQVGFSVGFVANAARRSSIGRGRTGSLPTNFPERYPSTELAILDDPPVRPACHVFVGSKAPWFEITDDLPQYPEYPPP
jgi:hypothetical protein